jgi:hypothetical protein
VSGLDGFWAAVDAQLAELRQARTAGDVLRILAPARNPYNALPGHDGTTSAPGFFAGGGGDGTVLEALIAAGWRLAWAEASYHYAMTAPDDQSGITYVEGDIYPNPGDRR